MGTPPSSVHTPRTAGRRQRGGGVDQEEEGGAPPKQERTSFMSGLIQEMGEAPKTFIGPSKLDKEGQRGQETTRNRYRVVNRAHSRH